MGSTIVTKWYVIEDFHCFVYILNPFTPKSDQDKISPYNINTISSRQVMRIEKNVNRVIIS